jgi:Ca-activated chloride channel family protein
MTHALSPRRLGLALLVSLGLAACGQNPPQSPEPPQRQKQEAPPAPKIEEPAPIALAPPPPMLMVAPSPMPAQAARMAVAPMPYMPPPLAPASTARYSAFEDRPWQRVAEAPVSTFSASVDTGSYANVRRFLNRGSLPPRDAVRVEELVNYFGYDYAPPAANAATQFAVDARLVASPWQPERGLLRIAIKGQDLAKQSLPPANLIFLVDVSGSMGPQDRLPLVRSALHLLTNQLRAQDRVGIVSYASGTRVVLEATPGDHKDAIHAAIDTLNAGGGTHGEAGIRLAYAQARAGFITEGINRVLLATDGDLNIGVTNPDDLKALVEGERKRGVGLTTLGVGDSNYNEALMKKLADVGDGSYHYLDTLQEAHKVLVNEMTSTLAVIAQDLKLQIEFNPALVQEYRLIGYELNNLTREQFNDDKVDAGDIGAGHTVTALYEIILAGAKGTVDPLRYQKDNAAKPADKHGNELAWLKLRYRPPGQADSKLVQLPILKAAEWPALDKADTDLRFAVAVAAWGQWLRGSTQLGNYGPTQIGALAHGARGTDRYGHRAEFERLMELSAGLKR